MTSRVRFAGLGLALAMAGGFALTVPGGAQNGPPPPSSSTPRSADGRPDLSGLWADSGPVRNEGGFTQKTDEDGDVVRLFPSRRCAPNQRGCRDNTNQSNDGELTNRVDPNRPLYRPEHWDKVQDLDYNLNFADPQFRCMPLGVPRVGPPIKIVQTPNEVILFYSGNNHDYRIVPTDGRGHDPEAFPTFYGDSVGHWEGETFVIDVVSRNDVTWLTGGIYGGGGGYFHSYDLHVVERLRRDGDTLHLSGDCGRSQRAPRAMGDECSADARTARRQDFRGASVPGVPVTAHGFADPPLKTRGLVECM